MRILIQSHMFPKAATPLHGTFVQFPAEALAAMGHEVTVVSPVPFVPGFLARSERARQFHKEVDYVRTNGVDIYYPRFLSIPRNYLYHLRGWLTWKSCAAFYRKLFAEKSFDVIHCHVPLPDGEVGMHLSQRYGIPFGLTVHGDNIYNRIHQSKACYRRIKEIMEAASFVCPVSPALYNLILENNIQPKAPFKVIYNGVNPPKDARATRVSGVPVKILSVCHMSKRKGIEESLRALAKVNKEFPAIEYHLIGGGQDLQYFKEVATECEIEDIAIFHGPKSNSECLQMMAECDVFLLPSWNEAFGVVYIEAMYYGMLTIGSRGEGIDGIIEDGKNGFLVKAKDVPDLAAKLQSVLPNIDSMAPIRKAARETVWPAFSWENNASEYLELYQRAIDRIPIR